MKDSTKRTIRTAVQTTLGAIVMVPIVVGIIGAQFPKTAAAGAILIGAAATIAKVWAAAEEKGVIPPWMRNPQSPSLPQPTPPIPVIPANGEGL